MEKNVAALREAANHVSPVPAPSVAADEQFPAPVVKPVGIAALREAAEEAAVLTKEMLQFIQDEGDYNTNTDNEKENQTILKRLKVMLPLAYLSPALKESIKRLLSVAAATRLERLLASPPLRDGQ